MKLYSAWYCPFSYRLRLLLKYYRDFELPSERKLWHRYNQWFDPMFNLPAFQQSMLEAQNYDDLLIKFYLPYSQGGGQENVTEI